MKKIWILVATAALLTAFGQRVNAQYYYYDNNYYDSPLLFEIGGSAGVMNCLSDVGGRRGAGKPFVKDLNIGNSHLNGGIYLAAMYKYAIGVRLEGTFGRISAYDSILKTVKATTAGRYERNLNFRSKINEISLMLKFIRYTFSSTGPAGIGIRQNYHLILRPVSAIIVSTHRAACEITGSIYNH